MQLCQKHMKILFICTHNRCRSIIAEAVGKSIGGDLLEVASAGSQPAGNIHPLTLHHLKRHGISDEGLKSQSWHDFEDFQPDLVITVCDNAANEVCPIWFGKAHQVHWGLNDPSTYTSHAASNKSDENEANASFDDLIQILKNRIGEIYTQLLDDKSLSPNCLKLNY